MTLSQEARARLGEIADSLFRSAAEVNALRHEAGDEADIELLRELYGDVLLAAHISRALAEGETRE